MPNIRLNPDGVIGAVVFVVAAVVIGLLVSGPGLPGDAETGFSAAALLLGAFGGNYLWDRWFPKDE